MNAGISDSSDSILFFTAKLDERGRIIVPAAIRRKLGISFSSVVFAGVEKVRIAEALMFLKRKGVKKMCSTSSAYIDAKERQITLERMNPYVSDPASIVEDSESEEIRFETADYVVLKDFRVVFK